MHLTSKQFAHAAAIAAEIESLEEEVNDLLQGNELTFQPESSPKVLPTPCLDAQENCDFSAGRQQQGKRDLDACGCAHSQTEQKAS